MDRLILDLDLLSILRYLPKVNLFIDYIVSRFNRVEILAMNHGTHALCEEYYTLQIYQTREIWELSIVSYSLKFALYYYSKELTPYFTAKIFEQQNLYP